MRAIGSALLVALCAVQVGRAEHSTVVDNGPNSNRVNIVFLGDGYTTGEIDTVYPRHIATMLDHMFRPPAGDVTRDPFPRYRNFFNVHRINVVSKQSGVDVPPRDVFRETALDAQYFFNGSTERLLYLDEAKADAVLQAELAGADFRADMRLVAVNDSRYGGAGGKYAVYAGGNSQAPELALHELGHSFSGLADEYGGYRLRYGGVEPRQINVTKDPSGAKWGHWLGYDQPEVGLIGAFEGGRNYDTGLYRPSLNSKMRSLDRPFDAVSREKIILDIYSIVDPLDDFLDNTTPLVDPQQIWVDPVDPDVIDVQWLVDGDVVESAIGDSFSLIEHGFGPGLYTVEARAFDPTGFDPLNGWVRRAPELLEESVTWTVTQTIPEPHALLLVGVVLLTAICGRAMRQARFGGRPN